MVVSVYASVTNDAMATSWSSDCDANWAETAWLTARQQFVKVHRRVRFNVAWVTDGDHKAKENQETEKDLGGHHHPRVVFAGSQHLVGAQLMHREHHSHQGEVDYQCARIPASLSI